MENFWDPSQAANVKFRVLTMGIVVVTLKITAKRRQTNTHQEVQ